MATIDLQEYVNGLGKIVDENKNNIRCEYVDALHKAGKVAMYEEHDIGFAMKCYSKAKQLLAIRAKQQANKDLWEIENLCAEQHIENDEITLYYNILLDESFYNFQSYIYFLERKRLPEKRFYFPRRKTLNIVAKDLIDLEAGKYEYYGLSLPPRVGKAIAFDTPVLTDHGWKKHGELTILDRVIGLDGDFKRILAIHTPCKMEYKVTMSDGEEIVCHGNHEWRVQIRGTNNFREMETKEMYGNVLCKDGHNRYILPFKPVVEGSHKDLWVEPYTLGAWLGDGRNQNPDICGALCDYAIVQRIVNAGYDIAWHTVHKKTQVHYYGFRGLREQLQKYGMCFSRKRTEKYIPSDYLIADEEQRLDLLAGLLDTDGTLNKTEHRYQYTTSDLMLKEDFISLINTFGWRTSVRYIEPTTSSSGIQGKKGYWVIAFNPDRYIPCQIERKQLTEFSEKRHITIEKIEKIERCEYGNCITVEDGMYLVGRRLTPTHNSTICILFLSWIMAKRPNSHNAMGGHSGILAKAFYKEIMNILITNEYCFQEIYKYYHPDAKFIKDKSAEEYTVTLDKPDRFPTLVCRGIDGTWTGAVDISSDGYLYVDDLVRDREMSMSPQRMENCWQTYLNTMVDRKNDGARELDVGTLWGVYDPLERMRKKYGNNPKYKFRRIPALDENDKSNFDYSICGFSSEYYISLRDRLGKAEWMAKYQQQPFVREGLTFPEEELRYFNGTIPDEEHKCVAVCDPAFGGGDNLSMPICADFGGKNKYIIDWVFNNGTQAVTIPRIVSVVKKHYILEIQIERNNGGLLYADALKNALAQAGIFYCKVTTVSAPNKISKEDKICGYSDYVKEYFVFLNENSAIDENNPMAYKRSEEYEKAMENMTLYSPQGKNITDDGADSITQMAMFFEKKTNGDIEIIENPFRSM